MSSFVFKFANKLILYYNVYLFIQIFLRDEKSLQKSFIFF